MTAVLYPAVLVINILYEKGVLCVGGRDISVLISHLRVAKIKNMLKDFTAKIFAKIRCLQKL